MRKKLIYLAIAVLLLVISIKFFPYHCNCTARTADVSTITASVATSSTVVIESTVIKVNVANTVALREQGLSGRGEVCADCGMLFIFDKPGPYGFWMKDMNFSLDIVWISADKKVLGVEKSLAPSTYPQIYYPSQDVLYVLELPAGSFDKHSYRVGDSITMNL